jgi:hypothetical protein
MEVMKMNTQHVCRLVLGLLVFVTSLNALAEDPTTSPFSQNHTSVEAQHSEPMFDFTLRLGQGGFTDDRSPIGKLGGGQSALDIKLHQHPVALSISGEYYTNSPDPSHPYEIVDMSVLNLLYMTQIFDSERTTFFLGGGIGRLEVPKGEMVSGTVSGTVYNLEAGLRFRLFWRLGIYGIGKYLYANKTVDNTDVIDFNELIGMIGLTLSFSL